MSIKRIEKTSGVEDRESLLPRFRQLFRERKKRTKEELELFRKILTQRLSRKD